MRWKPILIAAAIIVPLLALFTFGMTTDPRTVPTPLAGGEAPDFALEIMPLEGEPGSSEEEPVRVRLSDHIGDIVVVNFWASWCLPCREEHAPLMRVAETYQDRGVAFYGILYNDSPGNAQRWLEEMGGQSYPTLLDPRSRTAIDYGLYGVPETFFIGRDGRLAYKHFGPVTEQVLVEQIESLQPVGEEVGP